uniref:Uncharacterized protein n=1 Tax=Marinobacter nauticus TaxID=2743 RepID=A0A455W7H0_MARNT|nr:hypothetical protein YBY_29890 [Marinobacter nauticus]
MDTENPELMPEEETAVETHEEWSLRKRRERMQVTRYQAKAALLDAGLLDQCEAIVAGSDDPQLKIAWQEAGFIRRSAFVDYVGAQLNMTPEQLDQLFIAASKIK